VPPASKEITVVVDDISVRHHLWIFEIDSKQIAEKNLKEEPHPGQPPTSIKSRIFSRKVTTLRDCYGSNL
jgi:hypothetical protein